MMRRYALGARRGTPRRSAIALLAAAAAVLLHLPIGPAQALFAAGSPVNATAGGSAARSGDVVVHLPEIPSAEAGIESAGLDVAGFTACAIPEPAGAGAARVGAVAGETGIRVWLDAAGLPVVARGTERLDLACGAEQLTGGGTASARFALDPGTYVIYESTPRFVPGGGTHGGEGLVTQPVVVVVPPLAAAELSGEQARGVIDVFPKAAPGPASDAGPAVSSEVFGDEIRQTVTVPVSLSGPVPERGPGEGTDTELRITEAIAAGVELVGTSLVLVRADGTRAPLSAADFVERRSEDAAGSSLDIELTRRGLSALAAHPGGLLVLEATLSPETSGSTAGYATVSVNGERIPEPVSGRAENPNIDYFWNYVHLLTMVTDAGATAERPLPGVVFDVYLFDKLTPYCPDTPTASSLWSKKNVVADADGKVFNRTLGQAYYCFYQVSVPPGYKGGTDAPVLLFVNAEGVHEVVHYRQVGADASDLPDLPLTGSAASLAVVSVGALLLAAAGWLSVVRYRRGAPGGIAPRG